MTDPFYITIGMNDNKQATLDKEPELLEEENSKFVAIIKENNRMSKNF